MPSESAAEQLDECWHSKRTMLIRLLLADDHAVVRLGIRQVVQAQPDFEVVGEVADAFEVIPRVKALKPDVLVLDLVMPGMSGLEIIRRLVHDVPQTRIIVLSMHANEAYVVEALRHGASAYVLKGSEAQEVVEAIRAVCAGERYLSPPLSARSIEAYLEKAAGATLDRYETLSKREREILHLVAQGLSNREIAARLFINVRTVESHRASVMHKLNLHKPTDLVRYALRRGIVHLDE